MRLYRIADKVVSREKLFDALDSILEHRESGATQEEAARRAGVQREFVSFLERLGELRRGPTVALVAFPVANCEEVRALGERYALDFVLCVSQAERESIESGDASEVFNTLLETLSALRDFDTLVLIASDQRIATIEHILGTEVVAMELGASPLREDQVVDIEALDTLLAAVMNSAPQSGGQRGVVGRALRDAADLAGRWTQSRK